MVSTPLYYLNQFATTTLNVGGGLNISQTTGIIAQAVSGIDITKASVACLTFSDPINTAAAEWVTYTSINGSNELQGVVRGAEGFSAKTHSNGAVIAFPISESHINNLNAMFDTTGLDVAQIITPATPNAGRNKIYTKTGGKLFVLGSAGQEAVIQTVYTNTITSHATPTINTDTTDIFTITAQAEAITSMTTNLSGTPVNGQKLIIRIKDNGTARSITWGSSYSPAGATTTILGKTQYNGCIYNSTSSKWDIVTTFNEA